MRSDELERETMLGDPLHEGVHGSHKTLGGFGMLDVPLRDKVRVSKKASASFGFSGQSHHFDAVRISVASPEQIRSWSFGEVKKPETINYRTFKPERDGLFCARIFGPVKDYECICGKYKRMKYKGIVCERCGVEVTLMRVRRERMGHIELASPVAHVWFSRSLPSRIGGLLDMSNKALDRVLYFEGYVVLDPGMTPLEYNQIITEEEKYQLEKEYGSDNFQLGSGAEALKILLSRIKLDELREQLRMELSQNPSEMRRKKVIKRLKLVEAFIRSGVKPEWMIMDVIPVLPPELRPLVPLDGGRFVTSDLNDLYRRLINRNNRLLRLMELQAPDLIIRNEKRMLQEIADAFFDNGRRGRPILGSNKRPLKSMSDMLKGKQGRFRLNLLGKRVDYSGRSVIVVGPKLRLHQCGLPKRMALELFKPFVYSKLERYGFAPTIKMAKRMVERERPEVWDILEEIIQERAVLLNRAPTLHRLGIQAFQPILVEGKAIQLHPLVCAAYNADFDGDQMAVHVPLSIEAQVECQALMMSTNNILNPSNGEPIIVPTKDSVLGLYYLTLLREKEKGEGMMFSGLNEVLMALKEGVVSLHAKVTLRCPVMKEDGQIILQRFETTPGRGIFWNIMPLHTNIEFSLVNKVLTSKDMGGLLKMVHQHCGPTETAHFADRMLQLGFEYATKSGISFGKDDLIIPKEKALFVAEAQSAVNEYYQQHLDGLITKGERYNKITDEWTKCTERVSDAMMNIISQDIPGKPLNSVYMMANSGARGSAVQMRQLAAMRGPIARHDGTIIERAIISNFKEGLLPFEYFNSTHGSRKGLSDTALKTANAGHLTRRLVDVAQDSIVREHDCGSSTGLPFSVEVDESGNVIPLMEKIEGRVVADDVFSPSGELLVSKNTLLDHFCVDHIEKSGVSSVRVRSVVTCKAKVGVCALCYGKDLGRGKLVAIGEAVGVIAAQSIGEPGTQMTLKTFHSGGASQRAAETFFAEAMDDGKVVFSHEKTVENKLGQKVVLERHMQLTLQGSKGQKKAVYPVPYGAILFVEDGATVVKGQKLAEWDPYTYPVVAEEDGVAQYVDLVDGVSLLEITDDVTGISRRTIIDWKQKIRNMDMDPQVVLRHKDGGAVYLKNGLEARYHLSVDAVVLVTDGADLRKGDVIARLPREITKSRDITSGLPRIAELFEARLPKDPCIMSEIDGCIKYGKDYKTRRRLLVVPEDPEKKPTEYLVGKGRHILVQEGDVVKKGDILVDGNLVPHNILAILGVEDLALHMVREVQNVYCSQGVKINDKHIEVILRQMLRKVQVFDPGDTLFVNGDQVLQSEFDATNVEMCEQRKRMAYAFPVLQGITKASLQTESFISAASFQETTKVLIDAAIQGKVDKLMGLKENVITGRLIPAGTGAVIRRFRKEARLRDVEILAKDTAVVSEAAPAA